MIRNQQVVRSPGQIEGARDRILQAAEMWGVEKQHTAAFGRRAGEWSSTDGPKADFSRRSVTFRNRGGGLWR